MAVEEYITAEEYSRRLNATTYDALFNDDGTGVDEDAVTDILKGASVRATSWFPANYTGTLPFTNPNVPALVKELTMLYAIAMGWDRKPDYDRAMADGSKKKSEKFFAMADQMGTRLQAAVLRMVDAPEPTPANIGGIVTTGGPAVFFNTTTGEYTGGDF